MALVGSKRQATPSFWGLYPEFSNIWKQTAGWSRWYLSSCFITCEGTWVGPNRKGCHNDTDDGPWTKGPAFWVGKGGRVNTKGLLSRKRGMKNIVTNNPFPYPTLHQTHVSVIYRRAFIRQRDTTSADLWMILLAVKHVRKHWRNTVQMASRINTLETVDPKCDFS